jgi:hypothetical protein
MLELKNDKSKRPNSSYWRRLTFIGLYELKNRKVAQYRHAVRMRYAIVLETTTHKKIDKYETLASWPKLAYCRK